MKNFRNYVIALLAGLLVLSLSTQDAVSAGKSKEAKTVEYQSCLNLYIEKMNQPAFSTVLIDTGATLCAKYRP
jgi:adenine-specific DNA glycosylase